MNIGIYPASVQQSYGVHIGRRVVYAWRNVQPYTETILLNINNSPFHTYSKTPQSYADKVVKIYNTLKPEIVVVENEPFLKPYSTEVRSLDDMKLYWGEIFNAANELPGKCTNGGLTLPQLSYLYYNETQDQDFFTHNVFKKQELLNRDFQAEIANMQAELDILKELPIHSINIHYYFRLPEQVAGLIRMIEWVKQYTGKSVITNECGVYDIAMLSECVRIARDTQMEYAILYSGTGGEGKAQKITKEMFNSVQIL